MNDASRRWRRFWLPKAIVFFGFLALAFFGNQGRQYALEQAKRGIRQSQQAIPTLDANEQRNQSSVQAARHYSQGNTFIAQRNFAAAIAEYSAAIEIQTQLRKQTKTPDSDRKLAGEIAMSHINRGVAQRAQQNPDAAIQDLTAGIDIYRQVAEQGGSELTTQLAAGYRNRAYLHRDAGKLRPAIDDFSQAIQWQSSVTQQDDQTATALAQDYTDRGYAHHSLGNQAAATGDFDKAIDIRTRLVAKTGQTDLLNELAMSHNNRGISRRTLGNLKAAIDDFGKAIELRASLPETQRKKLANDLAGTYTNRGNTYNLKGAVENAIQDFEQAIEIRSIDLQGAAPQQRLQLVRNLCTVAWIYATHADDAIRNGDRALAHATRACELSEWKYYLSHQALAAAQANAGNFQDAIESQEQAISLAPANLKEQLRKALEIYQADKPFREPGRTP